VLNQARRRLHDPGVGKGRLILCEASTPRKRDAREEDAMLFVGVLIVGLGVVFIVIASSVTVKTRRLLAKGRVVWGEVVEVVQRNDWEGDLMNYPVVEFETEGGRFVKFESKAGTNWKAYSAGQAVQVLYDPDDPEKAVVHSFLSVWLGPVLCWFMAGGCCFLGAVLAACGGLLGI
jgi:hypothetical protein